MTSKGHLLASDNHNIKDIMIMQEFIMIEIFLPIHSVKWFLDWTSPSSIYPT